MQGDKLMIGTRWIVAICGLSLIAVLFVPMWRIDLNAPQYPEGLSLAIHAKESDRHRRSRPSATSHHEGYVRITVPALSRPRSPSFSDAG